MCASVLWETRNYYVSWKPNFFIYKISTTISTWGLFDLFFANLNVDHFKYVCLVNSTYGCWLCDFKLFLKKMFLIGFFPNGSSCFLGKWMYGVGNHSSWFGRKSMQDDGFSMFSYVDECCNEEHKNSTTWKDFIDQRKVHKLLMGMKKKNQLLYLSKKEEWISCKLDHMQVHPRWIKKT
jgi:hypothetical protein